MMAVQCMHGPEECLGNMVQLCAAISLSVPEDVSGLHNVLDAAIRGHSGKTFSRRLCSGA